MKRIDILPDDILLVIFGFYLETDNPLYSEMRDWILLVHVCRRWRNIVFGSPRRLNLQLHCTPETPARDTLDIWPALPLTVGGRMTSSSGRDNIIAALRQSNRVCRVCLYDFGVRELEEVVVAMQVPFPELTVLQFDSDEETLRVIPDSFLDGSAPRLQYVELEGIPFPGLPKLLLSATHLVTLILRNIPYSGYISPEAIVALLSVLSNLTTLVLQFESPRSHPDRETPCLPPPERSVIPSLTYLEFRGFIEYLEDLVTPIDAPQLDRLKITFFNQIDFDIPRVAQFINRTPKLTHSDAHVDFSDYHVHVLLGPRPEPLCIAISCREPDWQLSAIEQVCNSSLNSLSTVEVLFIKDYRSEFVWKDDAIENSLRLQLLLPFTAVKNLYLSEGFVPGIASALQELVGGRITEVLPSLQNIFVEGLEPLGRFQENTRQFVAARQLSDHPITISVWDNYPDMKPE